MSGYKAINEAFQIARQQNATLRAAIRDNAAASQKPSGASALAAPRTREPAVKAGQASTSSAARKR
jgi:hypothetical protein